MIKFSSGKQFGDERAASMLSRPEGVQCDINCLWRSMLCYSKHKIMYRARFACTIQMIFSELVELLHCSAVGIIADDSKAEESSSSCSPPPWPSGTLSWKKPIYIYMVFGDLAFSYPGVSTCLCSWEMRSPPLLRSPLLLLSWRSLRTRWEII